MAEKAKQTDVDSSLILKRDKSVKIPLNDFTDDALQAINGNTSLSILSVPQDSSVNGYKIQDTTIADGKTLKDYANAIKQVAEKYSIPYIDLFTRSNIYPNNATVKTTYMPDGLHPNTAGYERISEKILAFISSL